MDKYYAWLDAAIKKVNSDFFTGFFKPRKESDIECNFYHYLLETQSQNKNLTREKYFVFSEFNFRGYGRKFDLVILSREKLRLIVEIKETSLGHLPPNKIEKKIKPDIEKLRKFKKWLGEKGKTEILKWYRDPVIFLFFRGTGEAGIAKSTDDEMHRLQQKYGDVILKWGPIP